MNDHGTPDMFAGGKFTTKDGRANLMAHDWEAPSELPDDEYPLILCTVREVGHYSCRSMTGNCKTLTLLADEPGFVRMNPADAQARGIKNGDIVSIHSRRGQVYSRADVSDRINKGTVYMTYQWWIGKCNELTIHKVDPVSHTPEDKFSAARSTLSPTRSGLRARSSVSTPSSSRLWWTPPLLRTLSPAPPSSTTRRT